MDVSSEEHDSIDLEESRSYISLDTKEYFEIPYYGCTQLLLESNDQESEPEDGSGFSSEWFRMYEQNIKGKKITAVYEYESGYSNRRRGWEKCLIQVESGYLISERIMSPVGTGQAGLWIFTSLENLKETIGGGYRKVV